MNIKNCLRAHLNGEYLGGRHNLTYQGIVWRDFKGFDYSHNLTEMKVGREQN